MEVVAVLGASNDENRYSFQAVKLLAEKGHQPVPLSLKEKVILGYPCYSTLTELIKSGIKVDSLSMYVNPKVSSTLEDEILKLHPRRVIFNPGSENHVLGEKLKQKDIQVEEACTLVLLRTSQF